MGESMPSDPFEAELQRLLAGDVGQDAAPEGLAPLTAENIDEEVARMFGSVSEDDIALLGLADATDAANTITVRSLTGNLTDQEHSELEAIDQRAAMAARSYFAAEETRRVGNAIDKLFEDDDTDSEEDELVGARR